MQNPATKQEEENQPNACSRRAALRGLGEKGVECVRYSSATANDGRWRREERNGMEGGHIYRMKLCPGLLVYICYARFRNVYLITSCPVQ